ncbi:MAG: WhiB family transcriptional regulator [Arcanobacterium sp.]|nr:WhiB family transcriptional regulator [Arcanobacterium sp.]
MTLIYQELDWTAQAVCADVDPDSLYVRGSAQREARQICYGCPVRLECLSDALNTKNIFGVWGGLTERERRAILRKIPDETNWFQRIMFSDGTLETDLREGRVPRLPKH